MYASKQPCKVIDLVIDANCVRPSHETWTLLLASPAASGGTKHKFSVGYEYDGGIIITASHLPFNRNGFKFFTKEGGLEKGNIKDILQKAAAAAHAAGITPHARHTDDALVLDAALNTDPSSAQHVSAAQDTAMAALHAQHSRTGQVSQVDA